MATEALSCSFHAAASWSCSSALRTMESWYLSVLVFLVTWADSTTERPKTELKYLKRKAFNVCQSNTLPLEYHMIIYILD